MQEIAKRNIMQGALEKYKKRKNDKFIRKAIKKAQYLYRFDKEKYGDLFEQSWANSEMDPWHDDMENTILHHCEGCRWTGLIGKHQLDKNGNFYCTACSHDMKNNKMLRYGPQNNGFMEPTPECISKLTVTETMLISRACLIGKVFRLTGGQLAYKGHIINIAQDIQALASSLPRLPAEIETFIVCKPGQDINHKQLVVRKNCVLDALRYLKEHNPMYHDIEINESRLS